VSIAVVIIATGGERYTQYAAPLIASLKKFFPPHDVFLFTDSHEQFDAIKIDYPDLGWPRATLMRYHAILGQQRMLSGFDYIFYLDVDLLVVSKIEPEEILANGITAVLHGGFPTTFERRWESTAYVPEIITEPYYQGTVVGGSTRAFLDMCETISRAIDVDDDNGIMAIWHDESHLNRYLLVHTPAKVLTPAYCFSDGVKVKVDVPKIIHIEKPNQQSWKHHG
jgi:histo-blood group ABO system transferase